MRNERIGGMNIVIMSTIRVQAMLKMYDVGAYMNNTPILWEYEWLSVVGVTYSIVHTSLPTPTTICIRLDGLVLICS